jgi:glycogen synthase
MIPEILKKGKKTAVLIIAPETGRLPESMSTLARFISGKSGGLGDVVAAICSGLTERGIECHLATINLKKRFRQENRMDEMAWREISHSIDPERIHLVSSAIFDNLPCAYAGDTLRNAAEFQREMVNNVIRGVRAGSNGKLIIHSHDWMSGGIITAYARSRGCPVLHTVHNIHTGCIPEEMFFGVDLHGLSHNLYYSEAHGKLGIDCQATAIKNATLINTVGKRFLHEIVEDHFSDRPIIAASVREEIKQKYHHGSAQAIINALTPRFSPEKCEFLVKKYGPGDEVLTAKRENLLAFQKRTGLIDNPQAILFYWPSRLDPAQKGIELLEKIAMRFVMEHADAQIAVIGEGAGYDNIHEEIMGRIAWSSGGKITYQHFEEGLSMLGYAAANDVFGASLYEPCGLIDQVGNLFGTTATNRDTGGYHEKIRDMRLRTDGADRDEGNGFLFRDYDIGGLWFGLEQSYYFHRRAPEIREEQAKRIMTEARDRYDINHMIDEYIRIYETLNEGRPLS